MNDNSCLMTLHFDYQETDRMHQIFKQMGRSSLKLTHYNSLNLVHNDAFDININWHKQIFNTVSSKILQYIHKTCIILGNHHILLFSCNN